MNKLLTKALGALILVLVVTGPTASGQVIETSVEATIPFRFYAGDTWLPAGKYTITSPESDELNVLLLRNSNDTVEVFLLTNAARRDTAANEASLDFDRLGKKEFLSTIWLEGQRTGYQLEEPRLEKKLEKASMKKEKHSLKAVHHAKS